MHFKDSAAGIVAIIKKTPFKMLSFGPVACTIIIPKFINQWMVMGERMAG